MIATTQITNTEIFAFIDFLIFKLWSRKVFFLQAGKKIETNKKQATFYENSRFNVKFTVKL